MYPVVASIVALLLGAGQVPTPGPTPAPPPRAKPVDKKVCRAEGPATGSLMGGRRVCHLKSEWAAIDAANAQSTEAFRNGINAGGVRTGN